MEKIPSIFEILASTNEGVEDGLKILQYHLKPSFCQTTEKKRN